MNGICHVFGNGNHYFSALHNRITVGNASQSPCLGLCVIPHPGCYFEFTQPRKILFEGPQIHERGIAE